MASSKRSSFPCPFVARDTVKPFRSMVDGKIYDSMGRYNDSIKEANARTGRDYRIVGNDYGHLMQEPVIGPLPGIDRAINTSLERLGAK